MNTACEILHGLKECVSMWMKQPMVKWDTFFVPSTGIDGQNELLRQFAAQWNKKALIIDERFNDGGQIPDRFIEMLNRTPLSYVATRDGKPWQFPGYANFGPKVMLINGWSGSGAMRSPRISAKSILAR